jgi:hypothetical protein
MNRIENNAERNNLRKYQILKLAAFCQTQGRLKLLTELYVSEKSVKNSKYLISAPSYFS